MRRMRAPVFSFAAALVLWAAPLLAATVSGIVTDGTGAPLQGARVVLRAVATGQESDTQTDANGRYSLTTPGAGSFLVIVTRAGFAEAARTVVADAPGPGRGSRVQLELGGLTAAVSVTAARSEREIRQIPLHVETLTSGAIE